MRSRKSGSSRSCNVSVSRLVAVSNLKSLFFGSVVPVVPNWGIGLLLKCFDEPALIVLTQISDFIEKERIPIGPCEKALLILNSIGEGIL